MLSTTDFKIISFIGVQRILAKRTTQIISEKKLYNGFTACFYLAFEPDYLPFIIINKTVFAFSGANEAIFFFEKLSRISQEDLKAISKLNNPKVIRLSKYTPESLLIELSTQL